MRQASQGCRLPQIALLLTSTARALAYVVLAEAERRLFVPLEGTAGCAQGHARLVRALHERLDRLAGVAPQTVTTP
ncbi:hypothetical protein [Streptomyces decoyicus]|uniref:hypothetical protein n=1 Tax=Streptomyces decoyicus TaxID=249567 RepID=UPI0039A46827